MSYTKHTWTNGEIVTAAKMNNIETGIEEASSSGGVLVVNATISGSTATLDKTWQEINDASTAVVLLDTGSSKYRMFVISTWDDNDLYGADILSSDGNPTILSFNTSTANGYPSLLME